MFPAAHDSDTRTWCARHQRDFDWAQPLETLPDLGAEWLSLGRHWLGPSSAAVQPGWARVVWCETWIGYDLVFAGRDPKNRARTLNEITHQLGDVGEVFLHAGGAETYLEVHVTPENQRLQLNWMLDSPEDATPGAGALTRHMIHEGDWVFSATHVSDSFWSARLIVPAAILLPSGAQRLEPGLEITTAVCRYDCLDTINPALSSTAPFCAPSFHRREEWNRLELMPDEHK